jgi:hypothetical protein
LTVDLDELRAELRECAGRRELAADTRRAAAVGAHRACEDHVAVLGPLGGRGGRVEQSLHLGRGLPGPHQLRAPTTPDRERDPHGDHRLARAGLAREHVETAVELEVQVIDHPETTDVQLAEHGADATRRR